MSAPVHGNGGHRNGNKPDATALAKPVSKPPEEVFGRAHAAAARTSVDPLLGKTFGNYRIESILGEGGMGKVYLARHVNISDMTRAIKVLKPEFATYAEIVDRFKLEAQSLARLKHKNLVSIYDFGEQDGTIYITMEYLEGQNLTAALKDAIVKDNSMSLERIKHIMGQICDALSAVHTKGIVHRDLKPDNIILMDNGEKDVVKIIDFGIAKRENTDVTHVGGFVGTSFFASPEQMKGDPIDLRTDIYAAGAILYMLLVGKKPYEDMVTDPGNPFQVFEAKRGSMPTAPTNFRPNMPVALERVILKAMASNAAGRYLSMQDFKTAIMECDNEGQDKLAKTAAFVPILLTVARPPALRTDEFATGETILHPSLEPPIPLVSRAAPAFAPPTFQPASQSAPRSSLRAPVYVPRRRSLKGVVTGVVAAATIAGAVYFREPLLDVFHSMIGQKQEAAQSITITSMPNNARVYKDGTFLGVTPLARSAFEKGVYRFEIEGYRAREVAYDPALMDRFPDIVMEANPAPRPAVRQRPTKAPAQDAGPAKATGKIRLSPPVKSRAHGEVVIDDSEQLQPAPTQQVQPATPVQEEEEPVRDDLFVPDTPTRPNQQ